MEFQLSEETLDPEGARDPDLLRGANFRAVVQEALSRRFPAVDDRSGKRELFQLLSASGATNRLRQMVYADPDLVGRTIPVAVPVSDEVDQLLKGHIKRQSPETERALSDRQIAWVDELLANGEIEARFNRGFFVNPDSRDPELAGIASAFMGSAMALAVAFLLSVPIGAGAAVYLEEFAPKNAVTDFIEVNINNLAAVPSIVFGLLGLAVFLNFFGLPRSAPLVGGMVLALMTLPVVIIATRSALRAVPPSIFDAALSVGASPLQAVCDHKLQAAAPGILTGSIIGMARALGETAPLLMIGMVAFVTEIPSSVLEPASALPVQIFLWSDSPERAWAERTSAAIIVLLAVLVVMNAGAIFLRNRLERRWSS
jgi:phosphate transport system permease protein